MAEFLATFIPALGHALLHFLWQGALIGLLAAVALQALRHARPQTRYAVACLTLLACVLVPLATTLAQLTAPSVATLYAGTPAPLPHISAGPNTPGVLFGFAPPAAQFDAFLPWIVALWAAGTSVMSMRMALGLAWIRRLRHTPQGAAQAAWQVRLDALAMHFGLRRSVALRLVDTLDSPVSAGWWNPVVLLPAALLTRMPTDLIEALLAHELAHIRRHDYLINLLQNAVEALLFYHPVTWWLSHRIRIEREQIADQLAAEVACAPRRLALALSELADLQRTGPPLHLAQAAGGGLLLSRIEQLVRPSQRAHPSARIVFPLLGLAAACIASYSYAQIGKRAPDAMPGTHSMQASRTDRSSARDSFAVVRKGDAGITTWGPDGDENMASLQTARRALGGDFLWFVRAGRAYVVTDPALVDRARQAWRETDALDGQMAALSRRMEVHNTKMEALRRRMETLSEDSEPSPAARKALREMEALAARQQELAEQQQKLTQQQQEATQDDVADDAAAQQRLAKQMQALALKQETLAQEQARLNEQQSRLMVAENKRLQAQHRPTQAMAREMELASKPMNALGKQMDVLGRKHETAAEQGERAMRTLLSEALARNLAKPVPERAPVQ